MGKEALTYAEKRAMSHGIITERLGKECIGDLCHCRLTSQPAEKPVCTPSGIIFSKEAILENLLEQRQNIKREMKLKFDGDNDAISLKADWLDSREESDLYQFQSGNNFGTESGPSKTFSTKLMGKARFRNNESLFHCMSPESVNILPKKLSGNCITTGKRQPCLTKINNERSQFKTRCPITGENLSFKDLTLLKFTTEEKFKKNALSEHFIDPVTKDQLTNRSHLVCIRPTGDVILLHTFRTLIEPDGAYKQNQLGDNDVILLRNSGTGFIRHDTVVASHSTLLGLNSGKTNGRGQHAGSGTRSGLVLL
jgi:nitric oxide synthase-interacting protein